MLAGSLVKGRPTPLPPVQYPRRVTPHPVPMVRIEIDRFKAPPRLKAGTRSSDLRAWKPSPVAASDKGAGRSQPNAGHAILEVAVEKSWPLRDGRSLRTG
jgi:hypothetical protein